MRGARIVRWAGSSLMLLGFIASAQAAEESVAITDQDRLITNFQREAAVVNKGQLRLEVHGFTGNVERSQDGLQVILRGFPAGDNDRGERRDDVRRVSGGILGLRGSYGLFKNTEVGFNLIAILQGLRFSNSPTENEMGFGDMSVYAKYKHQVDEHLGFAGGLEARLPTGEENKRLGTGDIGINPFVSTRYTSGKWGVGAHLGYEFNEEAPEHAGVSRALDNVFNWSAEGLLRANSLFALRAEITGRHFDYGGARLDDVVAMPSIDYNYSNNITIRPFGLAGITDEALNWGLGLGVAMTFF